jgi:hypothetical protein
MGVATAGAQYVDICSSEWISRLRIVLAGDLDRFGLDDLDASVLQMTAPRALTQLVSRVVFCGDSPEFTIDRNMDTTWKTGLYSSLFRSTLKIRSRSNPTIQICSERSDFIR